MNFIKSFEIFLLFETSMEETKQEYIISNILNEFNLKTIPTIRHVDAGRAREVLSME